SPASTGVPAAGSSPSRTAARPVANQLAKPQAANGSKAHHEQDGPGLQVVAVAQRRLDVRLQALLVQEGTVGAVQVLDEHLAVFVANHGVLPGGEDLVGRFLVKQVDVRGLVVGTADDVGAVVDQVLEIGLQAADGHELGTFL